MRMVEIITKENWINDYDFFREFKASPYFPKLLAAYENLNTDILFDSKIHGQGHIERVIFYCLVLSFKYDLDNEDTAILSYAASLHDTKRENDGWDTDHGRRAAIGSIGYAQIDEADKPILQAVIAAHSDDDKNMDMIIKSFEVEDYKRALFLTKLFKDSDGLDRVRINRLDPSYLRNDFSKDLVDFAYDLYEHY